MRLVKVNDESIKNILTDLLQRSPNNYGKYEAIVADVVNDVKANGDAAVLSYTKKFDGCDFTPEQMLVTDEEIAEAYEAVDDSLIEIIRKALVNIREYHEKQRQYSWFDSKPDGTMRKLINVDKLHSLGWTHKVEIEEGVQKLFDWYRESIA